MLNFPLKVLLVATSSFAFSACDSVKNSLGLNHYRPDEYGVAPAARDLSIPDGYELRPPMVGVVSENSKEATAKTRAILKIGKTAPEKASPSQGFLVNDSQLSATVKQNSSPKTTELSLVNRARVSAVGQGKQVNADIRTLVDKEASQSSNSIIDNKLKEIKKNSRSIFNS